jgi:hypothetical protein
MLMPVSGEMSGSARTVFLVFPPDLRVILTATRKRRPLYLCHTCSCAFLAAPAAIPQVMHGFDVDVDHAVAWLSAGVCFQDVLRHMDGGCPRARIAWPRCGRATMRPGLFALVTVGGAGIYVMNDRFLAIR